jgi:hypothetical protein
MRRSLVSGRTFGRSPYFLRPQNASCKAPPISLEKWLPMSLEMRTVASTAIRSLHPAFSADVKRGAWTDGQ